MPHHENEHQRSLNDYWSCILGDDTSDTVYSVIREFLAAFIGKTECNTLHAPSWKWASIEYQQLLVMYLGYSGGRQVAHCHKLIIDCLYRQKWKWNASCPIFKMSVNRLSMIVRLPSWLITVPCGSYCLYISFWLLLYSKRLKNT